MLFKKKKQSLVKEVGDSNVTVYDFRRRSCEMFESYRALNYEKPYVFEQLEVDILSKLNELIKANATDGGNGDCGTEKILGPIRRAILSFDEQELSHQDFYSRQNVRRITDQADVEEMCAFWDAKLEKAIEEYENTLNLYENYKAKKLKEKHHEEK